MMLFKKSPNCFIAEVIVVIRILLQNIGGNIIVKVIDQNIGKRIIIILRRIIIDVPLAAGVTVFFPAR